MSVGRCAVGQPNLARCQRRALGGWWCWLQRPVLGCRQRRPSAEQALAPSRSSGRQSRPVQRLDACAEHDGSSAALQKHWPGLHVHRGNRAMLRTLRRHCRRSAAAAWRFARWASWLAAAWPARMRSGQASAQSRRRCRQWHCWRRQAWTPAWCLPTQRPCVTMRRA
jgi:hypothetical protein